MVWNPIRYLDFAVLCNRVPGKVRGIMWFRGMDKPVSLELEGDFHDDIIGTRLFIDGDPDLDDLAAREQMTRFPAEHRGRVGHMTLSEPIADSEDYPYLEWYTEASGWVLLEPYGDQITCFGEPRCIDAQSPGGTQQDRKTVGFIERGPSDDW